MQNARFDALVRSIAMPGSRRRLLRLLAGTALGAPLAAIGRRPRPVLAQNCDAGSCLFQGLGCRPCGECNQDGYCIQGDVCYGYCGPGGCVPANDGFSGCGGDASHCITNTIPCHDPTSNAYSCCPCPDGQEACGPICCDPGVPCTGGQCGTGCGTASARKVGGVGTETTTCCSGQQDCHGQCIPSTDQCCSTDAKSCGQACCGQNDVCCGTGCCPSGTECSRPGDEFFPPVCCSPGQSCGAACKGQFGWKCCKGHNSEGNRFSCVSTDQCCPGYGCCGPGYHCSAPKRGKKRRCVKSSVHRHPPAGAASPPG
jgi:hypothetical protein